MELITMIIEMVFQIIDRCDPDAEAQAVLDCCHEPNGAHERMVNRAARRTTIREKGRQYWRENQDSIVAAVWGRSSVATLAQVEEGLNAARGSRAAS